MMAPSSPVIPCDHSYCRKRLLAPGPAGPQKEASPASLGHVPIREPSPVQPWEAGAAPRGKLRGGLGEKPWIPLEPGRRTRSRVTFLGAPWSRPP